MSEAAPPRSPPSQPPRLLFASHLLNSKVSRSDHPTSPAMRRSWHHRRLAALAHDQLPKKHIATSTAVQRRSVNQGNAVNTTCKLLRGPPSTERATQTTQSRSQHRSWRSERRTVVQSPSNFASKLAHVVGDRIPLNADIWGHCVSTWQRPLAPCPATTHCDSPAIVISRQKAFANPRRCGWTAWLVGVQLSGPEALQRRPDVGRGAAAALAISRAFRPFSGGGRGGGGGGRGKPPNPLLA